MAINHNYAKATTQNPVAPPAAAAVPETTSTAAPEGSPKKPVYKTRACRTCGDIFTPSNNCQKYCEKCGNTWSVIKRKKDEAADKKLGAEKIIESLLDERDTVMAAYALCRDFKGKNFEISFNGVRITICKSN